jgi:DNA adenine methylase
MKINNNLFRWIGGKKWLSPKINEKILYNFNKYNIDYYIEPFCGGIGSLIGSLKILKQYNIKKILLNDINSNLINTFNIIKENPIELFENLSEIETNFLKTIPKKCFLLNDTKDKNILKKLLLESNEYYNNIRSKFNLNQKNKIIISSYFLFLMNHSFNGIYRENLKGNFNTPYNWSTKKINLKLKKDIIMDYHYIFNNMNIYFYNYPYMDFISKIDINKNNSLFYYDPPYLNKKTIENKYTMFNFGINEQLTLLNSINEQKNIIYSNHNIDIITNFFKKYKKYNIEIVYRSNIMTPKKNERSKKIQEILVNSN